jgi:hypothetical protein
MRRKVALALVGVAMLLCLIFTVGTSSSPKLRPSGSWHLYHPTVIPYPSARPQRTAIPSRHHTPGVVGPASR